MNDDMFEFDINAQLEQAEAKAAEKSQRSAGGYPRRSRL